MTREAMVNLEKHHMKLCIASFALAFHRNLGMNSDQIGDVLEATSEYSFNALCFQEVRKELMDEVGLDIGEYVEEI